MKPLPAKAFLAQVLNYNFSTGDLTWKVRPAETFRQQPSRTPTHMAAAWNAKWAGKPAFATVAHNGYLKGAIDGQNYYAHRIIWKLVHGSEPDDIDHEDGDRTNNRIYNLASKSRAENLKNRRLSRNNTSGHHGVSYSRRNGLWCASINDEGRAVHLGWFRDKSAAVIARQQAEQRYGYHANHGRCA